MRAADQERGADGDHEAFERLYRETIASLDGYRAQTSWFQENASGLRGPIAYFSMEFGITECLPIYSGGLGILAGDHLKSASELGIPMVGVGLLYQKGYFRQYLSPEGWQMNGRGRQAPGGDPTKQPSPEGATRLISPTSTAGHN